MRSVEMFSGAGGLAIGMGNAGFRHEALLEWNKHACNTLRDNKNRDYHHARHWRVVEGDVRDFDFAKEVSGHINIVAGGPPCQPFSMGGKAQGHNDARDMFPSAIHAVDQLRPDAFIFENVKGLLRASFAEYLEYVLLRLTYPQLVKLETETVEEHLGRLERAHTGGYDGLIYRPVFRLLNSADYGVPQKRERVFIVGFRADLREEWSFPKPTHSQDALLWAKWVTGEYWDEHGFTRDERPAMSAALRKKVDKLRDRYGLFGPDTKRWRTVRDAIRGLPEPSPGVDFWASHRIMNHEYRGGAMSYPGHTGSEIDEPSKALKAGAHGVPGGENMIRYPDGSVRYYTVRESARIQTFPDDYHITGVWGEAMRQLGNAVPVGLAEAVASSVQKQLARSKQLAFS
ncbi:DNA cytosine methyltransferase [Hymenobacter psychrophilus]|nr:DNA (cytosine-5-)-methyltransferase [Hymenobacter psychrophilus]